MSLSPRPSGSLPSSAHPPRELEEGVQRRLVLQAAQACDRDNLALYRSSGYDFARLDKEIQESVLVGVFLVWTLLVPLAIGCHVASLWRVRRHLRQNWQTMLENPDPLCDLWVLEWDVRRLLGQLPWRLWRRRRAALKELARVSRHWRLFEEKLEIIRAELKARPRAALEKERDEVRARLERETDPMTAASLQRRLSALEGQIEARQALVAWGKRLRAARDECAGSLGHLRTRLSLLAATGDAGALTAIEGAAADLHALNSHLAATEEAAEELRGYLAG